MNEWAGGYPGTVAMNDAALEQEFETRLRESSSLAFRVAYGVLRHRQDAEDAAQEAFVRAYRRFSQLRDRDQFRAWLVRMTWRIAIDRYRSDRRRTAREQSVDAREEHSVEQAALASERATRLWRAIDELAPKYRLVTVLAAIEGHDVASIAKLLQVPIGTVKSRLFEARKQLAEKLQCLAHDTPPL